MDRGYQKVKYSQNTLDMDDSGLDLIARKNPDEKYYFFMEKFDFEKIFPEIFEILVRVWDCSYTTVV